MYVPKLEIPAELRARTVKGLADTFYKAQKDVLTAAIDDNALPFFVRKYLKRFFELTSGDVRTALLEGDPWLFLSWRAKLAQVDVAMVAKGCTVAERWSIVRAQHMLMLMQMVANKRLVALGGVATEENVGVSDPNRANT